MKTIYLIPEESYSCEPASDILFGDVCKAFCPEEPLDTLLQQVLRPAAKKQEIYTIAIEDLVSAASAAYPNREIFIAGSGEDVLVVAEDKEALSSPLRKVMNVLIYISIFFGSALSVMYFHMDVSMIDTLKEFSDAFGGGEQASFIVLCVCYSIGMGLGMFIFFKNRRFAGHRIPSPIDAKLDTYTTGITSFLKRKISGNKIDKKENGS